MDRPSVAARTLFALLALTLALGVSGCGSKSAPGTPGAPAARQPVPQKNAPRPEDTVSPNMVAAVAKTKGAATSVQVKFELGARPEVGQPLEVDLVIVPVVGTLEQISGQVRGEDGLDVMSGAAIAATDKPVLGTPIRHHLSVLPRRDGVFVLSIVIAIQAGAQTESQTFSIPIIVGNGFPTGAASEPARPTARPASAAAAR